MVTGHRMMLVARVYIVRVLDLVQIVNEEAVLSDVYAVYYAGLCIH